MMAPLDVIISKNPMRTRQPDVLFVSHARLKLLDERLHGAPDLVVEILSPGNMAKKIAEKLRDDASIGVREAWVADRKTGAITVLHPKGGEFRETALYTPGQRLRSKVLPQLRLDVGKIFRR
jgi:Uma2 family endonuclease